ncbi:hypothetical protein J7E24_14045 [Hymenobacter sp. ISL-91]|uniref:hypothetical protein n=1 Tax=Hymenobacter sp. ISL-91 TaxID=2819151 RepID=UPI001BE9F8CE|nr:hypothetical protein [Hymenobacter sp. ISL-91]MBT2558913.1 hypothetical protein [Hymenobacter sp. ISL-91]
MNDNTTLAQQMVAAAPAATQEWNPGTGSKRDSCTGVGMARVARFILGQTDIRDCVPFLINRENVI